MKSIYLLLLIIICLMATMAINAEQARGIEGIWEGKLQVSSSSLRIVFRITKTTEGNLTATMDSPDQGITGIPVDKVILKDNNLSIEIKAIAGIYEGIINQDYSKIEGDWKQTGASFPLLLQKVGKAVEISRPQEPKKPFPYIEQEVNYENSEAGIVLAGTLTLPSEKGLFPAVLLISGSGPQDRNEMVFGHQPFLVLADYLTRQGIAVLRVDDRGVGESTGDFSQATSKDFASDVLAGIEYLKSREEVNSRQIGLIGHSEGGLIAPMVAVQSPDVEFIVLMAGPGLPGEDILYMQNELISKAAGMSEEKIDRNRYYNERLYSLIKEEENKGLLIEKATSIFDEYFAELTQEEKNQIGNRDEYVDIQLQNMLSPWFKFFLTYDPRPTLSKVSCPVLAINGSKDLQVPPKENLEAIEEALIAGGNKNYLIKELSDLNHIFQTAETGSPDEYARIEETISPVTLELIGDWILEQTKS